MKPKARRKQNQPHLEPEEVQVASESTPEPVSEPMPDPAPNPDILPDRMETLPNRMGMYRSYRRKPSSDPDEAIALENLCDSPGLSSADANQSTHPTPPPNSLVAPLWNKTILQLMSWWYGGSGSKSAADLDHLVQDVILKEDFDPKHLEDFSASRASAQLDKAAEDPESPFSASSGWAEHSVKIRLPAEYAKFDKEEDAPEFSVPGVFVRSLIDIVRDAFQDPAALTFHLTPFQQFWKSSEDEPPVRLYSELYTSDAVLDEDEKIFNQPRERGCELETVVAAIMLWSDFTLLASFGNASLLPIYAFFGNQSKYMRAKPTAFACHHLAYIPSVCAANSQCIRKLTYCNSFRSQFKITTNQSLKAAPRPMSSLTVNVS